MDFAMDNEETSGLNIRQSSFNKPEYGLFQYEMNNVFMEN